MNTIHSAPPFDKRTTRHIKEQEDLFAEGEWKGKCCFFLYILYYSLMQKRKKNNSLLPWRGRTRMCWALAVFLCSWRALCWVRPIWGPQVTLCSLSASFTGFLKQNQTKKKSVQKQFPASLKLQSCRKQTRTTWFSEQMQMASTLRVSFDNNFWSLIPGHIHPTRKLQARV